MVESRVERRVQIEVGECDRRRDPGGLEAEEGAVEHQHRAVEGETKRERRQHFGDDGCLARPEVAALVDEANDRLGEHRREDARRHEQKCDLPQAEPDCRAKTVEVTPGGEARQGREEHGRDGDREHALRQHVDPEGTVDRGRRQLRVDQPRGEHRVDDRIEGSTPGRG